MAGIAVWVIQHIMRLGIDLFLLCAAQFGLVLFIWDPRALVHSLEVRRERRDYDPTTFSTCPTFF
jgi:hypothetical protein